MAERLTLLYMPEGLRELQAELEAEWPAQLAALRATGQPLAAEGDGEGEGDEGEGDGEDGDGGEGEGEEWDQARAEATIKKQRKAEQAALKRAAAAEKRAKELEDAAKTDEEKREEAKATAEREATEAKAEAMRLRVAIKKGLTETQAKRLIGSTEDELEADADELLASFKQEGDEGEGGKGRQRPAERLRPGAVPGAEPEEMNPDKLAEAVPRQ